MKREYIIFKVYAECPLLIGWLRLGNDAGIFELVDSKEKADYCFFSYKPAFAIDTEESARVIYEQIKKSIIEFVYEILYMECQTLEDYCWLADIEFFGQKKSQKLSWEILNRQIELI